MRKFKECSEDVFGLNGVGERCGEFQAVMYQFSLACMFSFRNASGTELMIRVLNLTGMEQF